MSLNRGKSIEDMLIEVQAELAYQRHLEPGKDLTRSRKRVTALRNAIQKQNEEAARPGCF